MKFTFACGDIEPGCEATFEAADSQTLLAHACHHAQEVHGTTEFGPELMQRVRQHVHAVAS